MALDKSKVKELDDSIRPIIQDLEAKVHEIIYSAIPSEVMDTIENYLENYNHTVFKYFVYKNLLEYVKEIYQDFNMKVAITPNLKYFVGDTELFRKNIYEVIELLYKKVKKYTPVKKGLGNNEPQKIKVSGIDISSFIKFLTDKQCFDQTDETDLLKLLNGETIERKINYKLALNSFGAILFEIFEAGKISIVKENYYDWIIKNFTCKHKNITRPYISKLLIIDENQSGRVKATSPKYINIQSFL
jgi:hypothetical protein